eukprot:7585786-Pyramimonas_sp.AAC.2
MGEFSRCVEYKVVFVIRLEGVTGRYCTIFRFIPVKHVYYSGTPVGVVNRGHEALGWAAGGPGGPAPHGLQGDGWSFLAAPSAQPQTTPTLLSVIQR